MAAATTSRANLEGFKTCDVVVVCLGNRHRSPFLQALMHECCPELDVYSAGVMVRSQDSISAACVDALKEIGLTPRSPYSTPLVGGVPFPTKAVYCVDKGVLDFTAKLMRCVPERLRPPLLLLPVPDTLFRGEDFRREVPALRRLVRETLRERDATLLGLAPQ